MSKGGISSMDLDPVIRKVSCFTASKKQGLGSSIALTRNGKRELEFTKEGPCGHSPDLELNN
jgi:hypothetical protein